MSKSINWGASYKDPIRRKGASFKEKFGEAVKRELSQDDATRNWKVLEDKVRKSLYEHMVSRKPIRVMRPFQIFTERLEKSERSATYVEKYVPISPGTELTFSSIDRTFGQWIFKSATGEEFEIYDKPSLVMNNRLIPNPGFWGLLTCTHLYDEAVKEENNEEE